MMLSLNPWLVLVLVLEEDLFGLLLESCPEAV